MNFESQSFRPVGPNDPSVDKPLTLTKKPRQLRFDLPHNELERDEFEQELAEYAESPESDDNLSQGSTIAECLGHTQNDKEKRDLKRTVRSLSTEIRHLRETNHDQAKALETKDNELSQLRSPKARRVDIQQLSQIDFRAITPAEVMQSETPDIYRQVIVHLSKTVGDLQSDVADLKQEQREMKKEQRETNSLLKEVLKALEKK